jgi:hypothetical protein
MKQIKTTEIQGKDLFDHARDIATANKFNCYSKPPEREATDYETETELVVYFKWHSSLLEVTIQKLVPGWRYSEPPVDEGKADEICMNS